MSSSETPRTHTAIASTLVEKGNVLLERELSRRTAIKLGGLALAATAAGPILAACGIGSSNAPATSAKKVTMGMVRWRASNTYTASISKVVAQLKIDEPNLVVNYTDVDPQVLGETWAHGAIDSGAVDLVDSKSPKFRYLDPLLADKELAPLEQYYDLYGWAKYMDASTVSHSYRNGHAWMVPFYLELPGIAYQPSSLTKAGLSAAPATWEEFVAYLQAQKAPGVIPLTVAGRGFSFIMLLQNMFWASLDAGNMKNVIFGSGKWTDGPAAAAADAVLQLKKQGLLDTDALSIDVPTTTARFLANKAATVVSGTWFFATMQSSLKSDWGLFTPAAPGAKPVWAVGEDEGMVVAHNVKDLDATAAVIDYAIRGGGAKVYTQLGNFMNTSAAATDEIPQVSGIRKQLSTGTAPALFGWLPEATNTAWQSGIGNVLSGSQTPSAWAASVQKAWETDIAQGNVPADRASLNK